MAAATDRMPVFLRIGDSDEAEIGTIGLTVGEQMRATREGDLTKRRVAALMRAAADQLDAQAAAAEDGA